MRAEQHVRAGAATVIEAQAELVVVERLPEEVVDLDRRPVHHVDVAAPAGQAELAREGGHPGGEVGRRARERVVIHQLGELVVPGGRVPAPAVGVAPADRDVVVAGDAPDAGVGQERPDAVAIGAEAAEVAEAEELGRAACAGVVEDGPEGERVCVDAAEDRDPVHEPISSGRRGGWLRWLSCVPGG